MKENKIKIELQINITASSNNSKDLFFLDLNDLKEEKLLSKNVFSNKDGELFIIDYLNINSEQAIEIVSKSKIVEILKSNSKIKIILYIKFNEISNSFSMINSYKYQKIENLYKAENCERIWELFKKDEYNIIKEEDVIKIGHLRLKFDKIFFENNKKEDLNKRNNIESLASSEKNKSENIIYNTEPNETHYCRLCYQKEINNNDPLICPCKCNGSMKFVHLSCLKNNINLKIHKKHDKYYDMYLFQNYNCEICLATFPKYLIIKNKKINLLEIELSNYKNYALCDLIQYDENNDYIFHIGYLVLRLENEIPIKIGRKKENDVIFNDLSISGYHCELLVKNNILYLKDLGSKYGSMKYIRNEYEIQIGNNIELIYGKYKFEFNLIKKESFFDFDFFGFGEYIQNFLEYKCCGASTKDKGDYEVLKNNENIIENKNSEENKENKLTVDKMRYYEKFKDFDSYNDFIINMDKNGYLCSSNDNND